MTTPAEPTARRLRSEFARLYLPDPDVPPDRAPVSADLFDVQGRTRALVLELRAPAGWALLRPLWQGVQADLGQPAPGIAVSGEALQLWFSTPQPVDVPTGRAFLDALVRRYLSSVPPQRVRLHPAAESMPDSQDGRHADCVPAPRPGTDTWSAFLSPDLAGMFDDTPWLDVEPGADGQAGLLERLGVMNDDWLDVLKPSMTGPGTAVADVAAAPGAGGSQAATNAADPDGRSEARAFLRRVMDDETAPLALRIEAARALLQQPREGRG